MMNRKMVGCILVGFFTVAAQAGVKEIAGSWSVPSNIPGRTAAIYTIAKDGSVKTNLPVIPDDTPAHLMDGGKITASADGYVFHAASGLFERFAGNFTDAASKNAFLELAKTGVPMKFEGEGTSRTVTYVVPAAIQHLFPAGGMPLADGDLKKALRDREDERLVMESYRWDVTETKPCTNPNVTPPGQSRGSEEIFKSLFKKDANFRLQRISGGGNNVIRTVETAQAPSKIIQYGASYLEKSIIVGWATQNGFEQLRLYDQGTVESAPPGTHRFQTEVAGKCMEIIANQSLPAGSAAAGSQNNKTGAAK